MGAESAEPAKGRPGRIAGVPNRDKAELRALLQEKVHEFTELRRASDIEQGTPPDQAQEIIEDYDPVVALALVAVDRRSTLDQRIRCNGEVAQYVRAKLKSVEMTVDPDTAETLSQRQELSAQIVGALVNAASSKKTEARRLRLIAAGILPPDPEPDPSESPE